MAPCISAVARAMSTRKAAVKCRSARTRGRGELDRVRRNRRRKRLMGGPKAVRGGTTADLEEDRVRVTRDSSASIVEAVPHIEDARKTPRCDHV